VGRIFALNEPWIPPALQLGLEPPRPQGGEVRTSSSVVADTKELSYEQSNWFCDFGGGHRPDRLRRERIALRKLLILSFFYGKSYRQVDVAHYWRHYRHRCGSRPCVTCRENLGLMQDA